MQRREPPAVNRAPLLTSRDSAAGPESRALNPVAGQADTICHPNWHDGPVALYRDVAVVLRAQKLGEADRIVTLLTRQHGRIRAVAKGVRRTASRFGSRLEPGMHVDVQLAQGRSLDIVTQVELLDAFGSQLSGDYARYTASSVMLETVERLTAEEREPVVQHYQLLVGGLRALSGTVHAPGLVLDAFLLRSLAVAGFAPSCLDCARCGAPGPHRWFSVSGGGAVCDDCRTPGSVTPAAATQELLGALLSGDWAVADGSADSPRREAAGIVAAFLQWHLERELRSLPHLERA